MNGDWEHADLVEIRQRVSDLADEVAEMRGGVKTWKIVLALFINTAVTVGVNMLFNHQDAESRETARILRHYIEQQESNERHMETNR